MMTASNKRQANLSILQRLRQQGLPQREEQMDSMFDSLTGGEAVSKQDDEDEAPDTGDGYEVQSPEQQERERQKKKRAYERGGGETRLPAANQPGAKAFMDAFKKTR